MPRVAAAQPVIPFAPLPVRSWSARTIAPLILLTALWFLLCRELSGEWSLNEQYNYGWFVPFFALYLFWLRWQDRPGIEIRDSKFEIRKRQAIAALIGIPALLLLLPVRLFEIGTPEWRPLGWIHAASVATLTLIYIWSVGGKPWLRHFAFPIAFFFIAVPWVTPIEEPIIQGLMRVVAAVAAETVTLFGIPAQVKGNLIRVTNGLVGVNEACSGVRSLQTSLMIGLLFGELKRLSTLRRVALIAGAIVIAFVGNCARTFFLVWIAATKNIAAIDRWHDPASYAIVAAVFVGSLVLAMLLGRKNRSVAVVAEPALSDSQMDVSPAANREGLQPARLPLQLGRTKPTASQSLRNPQSAIRNSTSFFPLPASCFLFALCWIVAIELGAHLWYRAHESNLVDTTRWDVQWPKTAPNFRELKINEEMRSSLRFDQGRAASWTSTAATSSDTSNRSAPKKITCLVYFFRWNPGRNSALLANLHRPDVCLPAADWTQVADTGVRNYPVATSFALPFRHFEFRHGALGKSMQQMVHAFYCLTEDRVRASSAPGSKLPQMGTSPSAWTRDERLRQILEGRRHLGQQVMEVVFVTSQQIPAADAESRLGELVREVVLMKPASQ